MTIKSLENTVRRLSREVTNLRSFVIEIVNDKDDEGEYQREFVKGLIKAAKNKSDLEYTGKGSLLRKIRTA